MHNDGGTLHAAALADTSALWSRFTRASDARQFCQAWLALQCRSLSGARVGVVLWQDEDGSYAPIAAWPNARAEVGQLGEAAKQALSERRGLSLPVASVERGGHSFVVAYPLVVEEVPLGVVVVELAGIDQAALQSATQSLHWGAGWLEKLARERIVPQLNERLDRVEDANDLLGVVLEQAEARSAAMALCNEVATRVGASRVLLGFVRRGRVKLEAISRTAWFDKRNTTITVVENVMEEALDQDAIVSAPIPQGEPFSINVAHEDHRRANGLDGVVSVPLPGREQQVAVMTAEFGAGQAPTVSQLRWMEAVALLAGPAFEDKLRLRRWWAGRSADLFSGLWSRLTERGYAGWKLGALLLAVVVGVLSFAEQDYRVTAKAVIEGSVQRAAVAPFRGYVKEAPFRAGDTVRQGDMLAVLEDRDLVLEQIKWRSELEQASQKNRDALARRERAAVVQFAAQMRQAQAQLDLVEEKLARARITAPIDGLIVAGDLSQMLGSPVDIGETLFEIAPLDEYRVVLQVDERDINRLEVGQKGKIVLAGLSDRPLEFDVKTLTAVAEARDGSNVFRVEAQLSEPLLGLRPGMEGVGKVEVGRRSVFWVWTHPLVDWVRLAMWRWLP